MKLSVKKGDNVLVIAGKDAGKTGEILEVNATAGRVVVAGVNIQAHHNKAKTIRVVLLNQTVQSM